MRSLHVAGLVLAIALVGTESAHSQPKAAKPKAAKPKAKPAKPKAKPAKPKAKPAKPKAKPARSKPAPRTKTGGLNLPTIQTWKLDNGLEVAFMGVHKAPVVTVQVWYHVGAKEEARNRRGSAHMFEHMMFKGTERVRPEEHARNLNRVGGYVNAFTTEDVTAYHNTVPREYLDFALQLEAERMNNLLFRPKMIDTEREVVKEEIRQQENNPIAKGFLRFLEVAYTKHPYAWTAGGTIGDLDQTTPADLEKFYRAYYRPNNAMVVVVGDVSESDVRASVDRWFARLARGPEPPRPASTSPEPTQTKERREVVGSGQIGLVIGGFHIPEATHPDIYALQLLGLIIGAGDSSRLHKRLVRKDKIAVQTGSQALVREDPGLLLLFAAYLQSGTEKKIEAALWSEVARLAKARPTAAEVKKAKNQVLSSFVFGLESVTGIASQIGMSWIQSGDPRRFMSDLQRYEEVTAADIQTVARKYLKPSNRTVVIIPPAGPKKAAGGAK